MGVYVFFYLIEQHSSFCYIPYRCSLRMSRSIGATTYSYLKCIIHNTLEIRVCSCTNGSRNSQRAPVRYVTKTWSVVLLNKKIHILLSQVYCVWQVVKTQTVISNNPVFRYKLPHLRNTGTTDLDRRETHNTWKWNAVIKFRTELQNRHKNVAQIWKDDQLYGTNEAARGPLKENQKNRG